MARYAPDLRPERLQELSPGCGLMTRSGRRGLESGEDQISTDVRVVVQAPKSDLMARGIAFDLLKMAKRVGPQYEAAEYKDLSGEEGFSLDSVSIDD